MELECNSDAVCLTRTETTTVTLTMADLKNALAESGGYTLDETSLMSRDQVFDHVTEQFDAADGVSDYIHSVLDACGRNELVTLSLSPQFSTKGI